MLLENGNDDPGPARGVADTLLAALGASILVPYLQAIVTKAGEDTFDKIRDLLPARKDRNRPSVERAEDQAGTGTVTLSDPAARVVLRLPARLDAAQVAALFELPPPADRTRWCVVEWNQEHAAGLELCSATTIALAYWNSHGEPQHQRHGGPRSDPR